MLGTDWQTTDKSVRQRTAGNTVCRCSLCAKRTPNPKPQDAEYTCVPRCGGMRKPGEGGTTWCFRRARAFTLCSRCYDAIEPTWAIDKKELPSLFEDLMATGMSKQAAWLEVLGLNEAAQD